MKNKISTNQTYILLLMFCFSFSSYSQTLKYPKFNCDNLKGENEGSVVLPTDGDHSWCKVKSQTPYISCLCSFEKEMEAYRKEKERIGNEWSAAGKKATDLSSQAWKIQMEGQELYYNIQKSDNFENDKKVAIQKYTKAKALFNEAKTYRKKSFELCKKIYTDCEEESDYDKRGREREEKTLQDDLDNLRNVKKKVKRTISSSVSGQSTNNTGSSNSDNNTNTSKLSNSENKNNEANITNSENIEKRQAPNEQNSYLKRAEEQRIKNEQQIQAVDKLSDEISSDLTDIFSGEMSPMNAINITQSLLNSGLLTSVDEIVGATAIGGIAAIGIGVAQEIKKTKIRNNAANVKTQLDLYKIEYSNLNKAVTENDITALFSTHFKLNKIEKSLLESSNYLINKASNQDLKPLVEKIKQSSEKRNDGLVKLRDEKISNFHNLSQAERKEFAEVGIFTQEQIEDLRTPETIDGIYKSYNSNWTVRDVGEIRNGVLNGNWKQFGDQGNLLLTYNYKNGNIIGNDNFEYYSDGKVKKNLKSIENYPNKIYDLIYYYSNGNILSEGKEFNDSLHEEWKYYFENGEIQGVINYNLGKKEGKTLEYHKNGQKLLDANFLNNEMDGEIVRYYYNGKIEKKYVAKNGVLNGSYKSFYKNGQLKEESTLSEGKETGKGINYYENGKVKYENFLVNGVRDGVANWYYNNGQLKRSILYKSGLDEKNEPITKRIESLESFDKEGNPLLKGTLKKGNGILNEYDHNGEIERITEYQNGFLVKEIKDVYELNTAYIQQLKNLNPRDDNRKITTNKSEYTFKVPNNIEELVENTLIARGGKEKLQSVKTLKQTNKDGLCTSKSTINIDGSFVDISKCGDSVTKSISNGKEWELYINGVLVLKDKVKYAPENSIFFRELNFLNSLNSLKYSIVQEGNIKYYLITRTVKVIGKKYYFSYYYNSSSYTLEKEVAKTKKFTFITYYKKYKKFDGIYFPTIITTATTNLIFEEIVVNP